MCAESKLSVIAEELIIGDILSATDEAICDLNLLKICFASARNAIERTLKAIKEP